MDASYKTPIQDRCAFCQAKLVEAPQADETVVVMRCEACGVNVSFDADAPDCR